jgi:hypothetical protein
LESEDFSPARRNAPDVYGLPGAALFFGQHSERTVATSLPRLYAGREGCVAYVDESYELDGGKTFYIVGVAMVECDQLEYTRGELLRFYGGNVMHAAPMWGNRETESLRQATTLASRQNDGFDIVVCAPVDGGDALGDAARARCLSYIVPRLHEEFGVELFVFDRRSTPTQDTLDLRLLRDLRAAGAVSRNVVGHHCRPSEEPLLALPDIVAWSYRQEYTRGDRTWFEPMRACTDIKIL